MKFNALLLLVLSFEVTAHSGRLNTNGCHSNHCHSGARTVNESEIKDAWVIGYVLAKYETKLNNLQIDDAKEFWQGFKIGTANIAEYNNLKERALSLIPAQILNKIHDL